VQWLIQLLRVFLDETRTHQEDEFSLIRLILEISHDLVIFSLFLSFAFLNTSATTITFKTVLLQWQKRLFSVKIVY